MAFITLDPEIVKRLTDAHGSVDICDDLGQVIGTFHPVKISITPEYRAELEELRKDRSGKPFEEVLARLKAMKSK